MKSAGYIIDRLKFYREIAEGGLEYTPPPQFFKEAQEVIEDLLKQINTLKSQQEKQ